MANEGPPKGPEDPPREGIPYPAPAPTPYPAAAPPGPPALPPAYGPPPAYAGLRLYDPLAAQAAAGVFRQPLPAPLVLAGPAALNPVVPGPMLLLNCPLCHYYGPPRSIERISPTGWAVFVSLMLLCMPLFWIGLLIKERVRVCPGCGTQYGVQG